MEAILLYLLKVTVAITLFYTAFYFLFRKSKQFVFIRFYLLTSLVAAFIIPLISITVKTTNVVASVYSVSQESLAGEALHIAPSGVNYLQVFYMMVLLTYLFGVIISLARFYRSYQSAYTITRQCKQESVHNVLANVSDTNICAFTFFQKVVIGRDTKYNPSISMVLHHELVHARELHTIDILVMEFLHAFQWFNPFTRRYCNAIRMNLEFRADDIVAQQFDMQEYQLALVSMAYGKIEPIIFNKMSSTNLKNRVIMMKKQSRNRVSSLGKMLVIPMYVLLVITLSSREHVVAQVSGSQTAEFSQSDDIKSIDDLRLFMVKRIIYPEKAFEANQTGEISLFFSVDKDGRVGNVSSIEPDGEVVDIDEIVVAAPATSTQLEYSSGHKELIDECKRVVATFPILNIPELMGKTAKIQVLFAMQP